MRPSAPKLNLLGLNREDLEAFCVGLGEKPFRASQILKWIHQHGLDRFEPMTNLSKSLRTHLDEIAEIRPPQILSHQTSHDGTCKWLLQVAPGNCVETVFIPEEERGTLCVSSQVGCALNCSFCATAQQGFNRNLDASEIVGQLWLARRLLVQKATKPPVTNVVLMGMGEPLLNYDNVVRALDVMLEDCAYGLARRRVTLSTAGVIPGLKRLRDRCPVSLAVSLHAPDDELRSKLVPLNRSYPIHDLLAACWDYVAYDPKQKVTFEYVMLDGVNDTLDHARRLAKLIGHRPAKVNLIPFNPFPGAHYRRSPPGTVNQFRDVLMKAGLMTITRKTRGDDIAAACGQLIGTVQPRSRRVARRKVAVDVSVSPAKPRQRFPVAIPMGSKF